MNVREKFVEIKWTYEKRLALIDVAKKQLDLTLEFKGVPIANLHKLILVRSRYAETYHTIKMSNDHLLALNTLGQEYYLSEAQMSDLTFYFKVSDQTSYSNPVAPVAFSILEQNLPVRESKLIKVSVDGEFLCEVNSYDCNHSTNIFDILNVSSITENFPEEISKFFSNAGEFNARLDRSEIIPDKSINFVTRKVECDE